MKLIDRILSPLRSLRNWYITHRVPYIEMVADTEQTYISKALWRMLSSHNPDAKEFTLFFEKYPNITRYPSTIAFRYRFFVNTDISEIHTPDGSEPFTCKLQLSRFGHMGFQCVQPTPIEILTEYRIADAEFCEFHMADRIRLRVSTYLVNGNHAYDIHTTPM